MGGRRQLHGEHWLDGKEYSPGQGARRYHFEAVSCFSSSLLSILYYYYFFLRKRVEATV